MHRLPSLNSLRAFDAAARNLAFTAAAAELHVTHGAVSRQVAALEEELGVALFTRGGRGLKLTPQGAQLAASAGAAFATLRAGISELRQAGPAAALRVSVPPTLAMRWLIPRLTALHHAHPRLPIELSTSTEPVDFGHDPVDAAIRRVVRAPAGVLAQPFLDGRSVPVCSPAYQKQHRLRSPADLDRATLIITRSEPAAWPAWLGQYRIARRETAATLTFEQLYFALQAALDSLGVALVPIAIVQADLQAGRLKALARPEGAVSPRYALLSPRVSGRREAIATLGEWLKAAAGATQA